MERKNVDILLFIEHIVRELDISCAVKHLLQKRHGITIELASTVYNLADTLKRYQPRVIALPYGYSAASEAIRDILPAWPKAIYVNLAYEQVFTRINQAYKSPQDDFARRHMLYHAWGNFFAGYLKKNGVPEDLIYINGNPSYTLYRQPYSGYFEKREALAARHELDASRRWVLIPENYGVAFYSDYKLQDMVLTGISIEEAYSFREFARASLRAAAGWWQQAAAGGQAEIIVRPRPAISKAVFVDACRQIIGEIPPHLHFIKDGSVREWILSSDVVLSSYSTTLIEAAVAGKPAYMLAPLPFPQYAKADWYDLAPKVETGEAFLKAALDGRQDDAADELRSWAEGEMMSRGDSIANIADWLAAICRGQVTPPPPPETGGTNRRRLGRALQTGDLRFLAKFVRRMLSTELRRLAGKSAPPSTGGHEQDAFEPAAVAQRVSRWAEVLG